MDTIAVYFIGVCALFGLVILLSFYRFLNNVVLPWVRHRSQRHPWIRRFLLRVYRAGTLRYRTLWHWRPWPRLTWLQFAILLVYFTINGLTLGLNVPNEFVLEVRLALSSVINLTPVFLGGRTNPLANYSGVSLSTYYLVHHWLSVIATNEAIVHGILAIFNHRPKNNLSAISAYIATGCLLCIPLPICLAAIKGTRYRKSHFFLSLVAISSICLHVMVEGSTLAKALVYVCCALWISTHIYRLTRLLYQGNAEVSGKWEDGEIMHLQLTTPRPMTVYPGSYFYASLHGSSFFYRLFKNSPMTVSWWEPGQLSGIRDLTFMSSLRGHKSLPVKGTAVLLDGPYGPNLDTQKYETVILVAKGSGILGLLSFAHFLLERKNHDLMAERAGTTLASTLFRDKTRRVDVFWLLEHKGQAAWIEEKRKTLKRENQEPKLLAFWRIFPPEEVPNKDAHSKATVVATATSAGEQERENKTENEENEGGRETQIDQSPIYFRDIYPKDNGRQLDEASVIRRIRREALCPGNTIVLACGDVPFVELMRSGICGMLDTNSSIKFVEVELCPTGGTTPSERHSRKRSSTQTGSSDVLV